MIKTKKMSLQRKRMLIVVGLATAWFLYLMLLDGLF